MAVKHLEAHRLLASGNRVCVLLFYILPYFFCLRKGMYWSKQILSKPVSCLLTIIALLAPNIFRHLPSAPLNIFEILSFLTLLLIFQSHFNTCLKTVAKVPLSCFLECPSAQDLWFSLCDTYKLLGHIQQSEFSRLVPSKTL